MMRVLIADRDIDLLTTYQRQLAREGIEVVTATTGLECVEQLRQSTPELLVLDPQLPWGRSEGVLALMHEEWDVPAIPVLVLSDREDYGGRDRLAPFGIADFQLKPLTAEKLAERIRVLLGLSESAAEQPS